MGYRWAADAVLVGHLAFVLFAVFGSLLALRWTRVAWLHLPITAWAIFVELSGRICPLTPLENELRRQAGQAGYQGGFIEHYVLGALYPDGLTRGLQLSLGLGLLLFNAVVYGIVIWRRWRARRQRR